MPPATVESLVVLDEAADSNWATVRVKLHKATLNGRRGGIETPLNTSVKAHFPELGAPLCPDCIRLPTAPTTLRQTPFALTGIISTTASLGSAESTVQLVIVILGDAIPSPVLHENIVAIIGLRVLPCEDVSHIGIGILLLATLQP